jgi:NADPH:quinone reductase-like Zn-dependent oxidoreductase
MRAVLITEPGEPEVLQWLQVPDPVPGPDEVLIWAAREPNSTSAPCWPNGRGCRPRVRPVREKAAIIAAVREHVWPLVGAGKVAPVVDRELPMSGAAVAHRVMAASAHVGKILLLPN